MRADRTGQAEAVLVMVKKIVLILRRIGRGRNQWVSGRRSADQARSNPILCLAEGLSQTRNKIVERRHILLKLAENEVSAITPEIPRSCRVGTVSMRSLTNAYSALVPITQQEL